MDQPHCNCAPTVYPSAAPSVQPQRTHSVPKVYPQCSSAPPVYPQKVSQRDPKTFPRESPLMHFELHWVLHFYFSVLAWAPNCTLKKTQHHWIYSIVTATYCGAVKNIILNSSNHLDWTSLIVTSYAKEYWRFLARQRLYNNNNAVAVNIFPSSYRSRAFTDQTFSTEFCFIAFYFCSLNVMLMPAMNKQFCIKSLTTVECWSWNVATGFVVTLSCSGFVEAFLCSHW